MNQSTVDPQVQLLLLQALLTRRDKTNRNEVFLSNIELEVLLQIPRTSIELVVQWGKLVSITPTSQYSYSAVLSAVETRQLSPLITEEGCIDILECLRTYRQLINL